MYVTKNDLSAGLAKLDYEAMLTTAKAAVGLLAEEVDKHAGQVTQSLSDKKLSSIYLFAQWAKRAATQLEICAETLAALMGAQEGRRIEVVNAPPHEEEA